MNEKDRSFSRREILGMSAGLAGLALSRSAFAQSRTQTPEIETGPFYPALKPLDQDADLTLIAGRKGAAAGQVVHIVGRVINSSGTPVSGARIEIWQANTHGRYTHSGDASKAPLDPNFTGFGIATTDTEGRYRFKTIKPGSYPVSPTEKRTPHLHVDIMGKQDRLVTQMFFPGEPMNETDGVYKKLGADRSAAIATVSTATKEIEANAILLNWDIVLFKG